MDRFTVAHDTVEGSTFRPSDRSFAFLDALVEMTRDDNSIGLREDTFSVQFSFLELSLVVGAVSVIDLSISIQEAVLEFSFVNTTFDSGQLSVTVRNIFLIHFTFIAATIG